MKTFPESEANPLLNDVVTGSELVAFREATLGLSIDLARRRRRARVRNRLLTAAVVPLLLVLVGSQWMGRRTVSTRVAEFNIVHTRSLRPEMQVGIQKVALKTVHSGSGNLALVATDYDHPGYRTLSDEALLALFRGRPVGLISDLQGQRHLVFLDGKDPRSSE